jgi:hypothetical protein
LTGSDAGDAAVVIPKKDVSVIETSPPPYQTQGKKCVATDAAVPLAWVPGDAGAPVRPPIMQSSGGPVVANPIFVPMTFDGDDLRDPIEDFIASVGCSTYWNAIVPDYGIGEGITGAPDHMSDTAPTSIDDTAIGPFIYGKIMSQEAPAFVPNQTIYVIYYPEGTDITLQGDHSCESFGGYHNEFEMSDGTKVPYAVIPRCGTFDQLGGIDAITAVSSHELLEASSDPLPETTPAYQFPEPNGLAWALIGGGEIGDMCEFNTNAFYKPTDYPFYVQHGWTSHAAFLAQDPCQPSMNTYFAAAPTLPDTIPFMFGMTMESTPGIKLGVGDQTKLSVTLITSGTWPDVISVQVLDGSYLTGGSKALSFSPPNQQGNIGDTLQFTISRTGTDAQYEDLEPFEISATSTGYTFSWWGVVGNP